jgi:hypothetical protein
VNSNISFQGDSKLNTPIAVRFLGKVYELTGQEKYKRAALKAAEFSYDMLYQRIGKYIGGTPDNPNTVDKEAAIYAMNCFSAAYDLSGDRKYLSALEHAAVSVMSWIQTYDYAVPYSLTEEFDIVNPFKKGRSKGLSFIATGYSAVDMYASTASYELFKLYVRTGKSIYKQFAGLLQNNNKIFSNYDGSLGYANKAFMLEACNLADFMFYTAGNGVWLPWVGVAYAGPTASMKDTFGKSDLYELDGIPLEILRAKMATNGLGAKVSSIE